MKTLRQLFAVIVLTFMLALSSYAGDIHTTDAPPEPASAPATTEGQIEIGRSGDIHTGDSDGATAGDAVAEAALSLLQGVLSLL